MNRILLLLVLITQSACSDAIKKPFVLYQAEFDTIQVKMAADIVKETAQEWGMEISENDRDQMRYLTQDQDAFFISLEFKGDSVLSVNNVGVGDILSVMAIDYGKLPISDLESLVEEIRGKLQTRLGLDLVRQTEGGNPDG